MGQAVPPGQPIREELVKGLMDLFARTLDHQGTCLETLELTYAQAKVMWRLEAGDTPSLKELAKRCGVDPSNLAGVVDQLTERRLVVCLAQNPSIEALSPEQQDELLQILREVA